MRRVSSLERAAGLAYRAEGTPGERAVLLMHGYPESSYMWRHALVTHDWGVMVGLRWACEHPDSVGTLVISDGGFFADRRWHDLANAMRTTGEGERLIGSYTSEACGVVMGGATGGRA